MNIKNIQCLICAAVINVSMNSTVIAEETNHTPKVITPTEQSTSHAKSVLMAKLADLEFFSANFSQELLSDTGDVLENSRGKLAISKPNLANWHTTEPDELAIISDGQDVWFYNPWIEQVSAYSLSAAIAKTPILLLTSKDESLWQQYSVSKNNEMQLKGFSDNKTESFVITANDTNSQIKSLTLVFNINDEKYELSGFSFLDTTGQLSNIKLQNFDDKNEPASELFKFIVPEGVQVDDQREH